MVYFYYFIILHYSTMINLRFWSFVVCAKSTCLVYIQFSILHFCKRRTTDQSMVENLSGRDDSDRNICYWWYEQHCSWSEDTYIFSEWIATQWGQYECILNCYVSGLLFFFGFSTIQREVSITCHFLLNRLPHRFVGKVVSSNCPLKTSWIHMKTTLPSFLLLWV